MCVANLQNVVFAKVAVFSCCRANAKGLIGPEHMFSMSVSFAVHCHGGNTCERQAKQLGDTCI